MLPDLRYAGRRLRRSPGFTVAAILTLALGIGAETALVSIIHVLTAHPGRTEIPADSFVLTKTSPDPPSVLVHPPSPRFVPLDLFHALDTEPRSLLRAVGAAGDGDLAIVQAGGRAEMLMVEPVTAEYAAALGARPELGQWVSADDDRSRRPAAVVSHRLWQRWFGGRPVLDGASIRVNRAVMTVTGVMSDGFDDGRADVWIPLSDAPVLSAPLPDRFRALAESMRKFVRIDIRLAPGVPPARLDRLINDTIASAGGFGDSRLTVQARRSLDVVSVTALDRMRPWLLALSSLILLGACANLANMVYARGTSRSGEVAVRLSLGADGWRVTRIFLAEALLLAGGATAVAAVMAAVGLRLFGAALPAIVVGARRSPVDFTPDAAVFGIALIAGAIGAVVVGLLTGWRAVRGSNTRMLATAAQSTTELTPRDGRTRTGLVAVQITAAVVLVVVAGLYLQNGPEVPDRRLAFDTTHVATGRIVMDPRLDDPTRREVFAGRLLGDARTLPRVEGVAVAATIPAGVGGAAPWNVTLSADDGHGIANAVPRRITAKYSAVSPGIFSAMGLRLMRGRDFGPSDAAGQPRVIILSRSAAEQLWPGQDPIGKTMAFNRGLSPTVIGISEDPIVEDSASPFTQAGNFCFVPLAQWADLVGPTRYLIFRSAATDAAIDAMQAAVRAIDEDVALVDLAPLDRTMFEWYAPQRAVRLLMSVVSGLALGIALLGVYGVITYFVTARTREFGIRMALGATPAAILKLVVDHAIHIVLVGLLAGVFVASVTTRLVEHEVFATMPNGLATWIVVPLLVLVTGVLAAFLPARRAAAVDPNVSLRE